MGPAHPFFCAEKFLQSNNFQETCSKIEFDPWSPRILKRGGKLSSLLMRRELVRRQLSTRQNEEDCFTKSAKTHRYWGWCQRWLNHNIKQLDNEAEHGRAEKTELALRIRVIESGKLRRNEREGGTNMGDIWWEPLLARVFLGYTCVHCVHLVARSSYVIAQHCVQLPHGNVQMECYSPQHHLPDFQQSLLSVRFK